TQLENVPRGVMSRPPGAARRTRPQADRYAIAEPSGDHGGGAPSVASNRRWSPLSPTLYTAECVNRSGSGAVDRAVEKGMGVPSGDQAANAERPVPVGSSRWWVPSAFMMRIWLLVYPWRLTSQA